MALLIMPPLGVKAIVLLLRAPEPLNQLPGVPLDARTANSSPLIALTTSLVIKFHNVTVVDKGFS